MKSVPVKTSPGGRGPSWSPGWDKTAFNFTWQLSTETSHNVFEFNFFFNGTQLLYCHIFGIYDKDEFILLIVSCNIRPSAGYDLFGENPKQIDNVVLAQDTVFFLRIVFLVLRLRQKIMAYDNIVWLVYLLLYILGVLYFIWLWFIY